MAGKGLRPRGCDQGVVTEGLRSEDRDRKEVCGLNVLLQHIAPPLGIKAYAPDDALMRSATALACIRARSPVLTARTPATSPTPNTFGYRLC